MKFPHCAFVWNLNSVNVNFPYLLSFAIDGSQKCLVSKKSYFFLGWHKKLPKKTWKIVKAFTSFWIWSSTPRHSCRWTCLSLAFLTPCYVTRTTTFINWVTTLWPQLQTPPEMRTSISFLPKKNKILKYYYYAYWVCEYSCFSYLWNSILYF